MFIRNKIYIGRLIEISKSKSFNNMFRSCYEKNYTYNYIRSNQEIPQMKNIIKHIKRNKISL